MLRRAHPEKIGRLMKKMRDNFFWNFYLRALLEAALEVSVLSMMDTYVQNFSSWGYVNSFAFSVIALGCLAAMILWMRLWLRNQELSDKRLETRVGSLYEGLKAEPESITLTEWFMLRRVIFAAAAFYGLGQLWISFTVVFQSSIITIALN
mmetsp:Transcript_44741/g.59407  ORF Transcript_44741/g.59407 Transcript_44741/m.59407 type:complete len:151 (-) Transcript_44741:1131-1583(-)